MVVDFLLIGGFGGYFGLWLELDFFFGGWLVNEF